MTATRDETVHRLTPDAVIDLRRAVAVEAPVAVEINGFGYAVMMMTPAALPEFACGFLLTERIIEAPAELLDCAATETVQGWILRATVARHRAERVLERVRHRTSDTACGLCGIASLEQLSRAHATRPSTPRAGGAAIFAALENVRDHQPLNRATGALHAAAFCDDAGRIVQAFEDVGRHNALDKLIGCLATSAHQPADGFVLVTSRISFEMVDKALVARMPLLVGISAPTSLAIDHARANGLTLIALARSDAVLVANDPHGLFVRETTADGSEGGT